jgi:hypothetical protein
MVRHVSQRVVVTYRWEIIEAGEAAPSRSGPAIRTPCDSCSPHPKPDPLRQEKPLSERHRLASAQAAS